MRHEGKHIRQNRAEGKIIFPMYHNYIKISFPAIGAGKMHHNSSIHTLSF
jgi:hypothetical protein